MSVSSKIRQVREAKGLKQQVLADALGMKQATYSKLENGTLALKVQDLEKIAQILEIPIEELYREYGNVQYNSHNHYVSNQAFYPNDFENLKSLYERLLSAKEAELEAERKLLTVKDYEILLLKNELAKYK